MDLRKMLFFWGGKCRLVRGMQTHDAYLEDDLNVSHLTKALRQSAQTKMFELFSDWGNKHGSWEITFWKKDPQLKRFVSLALTNLSIRKADTPMRYDLEISAGAEDGFRYRHGLIGQFNATGEQLANEEFVSTIEKAFGTALDSVMKLTTNDLTEAYGEHRASKRSES